MTGGAGFIGSSVVDALTSSGAPVLAVDDLSHGRADNLRDALGSGAELAEIDIRDATSLRRAFSAFRPDTVFHLAAQIDVRKSMVEPALDAGINVLGTLNVLAAALEVGVRRVVNTSTGGAIYGETDVVPTPETVPANPLSAYGLGKRTAEEYGSWFRRSHGLEVLTLRYGNVYGPRQDPRGDAGVIAIFCDRVLSGQRPVVFGDGKQTRDYVFVGDIVAANLAAAEADAPAHEVYNVGTGTEVDVLTLAGAIADAAGVGRESFAPELRPARPGEVLRSCLDVRRAREDLGLGEPTPLADGLRRTLGWVRTLPPAERTA